MKTCVKKRILLPALIAGLGLLLTGRATAQTFTILHTFTAVNYNSALNAFTNSDGAVPVAGLILSGNILYGTMRQGGNYGSGTVFAVHTDGTDFTNLYSFTAYPYPYYTNSDGALPLAGLILSGNTLYGTTSVGGPHDAGTVFAINTDGTGFRNLYSFFSISSDGINPCAGLVLSGNTLYGTASYGGTHSAGTIFAVNTNGTTLFDTLYNFTGGTDGGSSVAGLTLSSNILYGTTRVGVGSSALGAVFAFNTNNGVLSTLHDFPDITYNTNSDGGYPQAGLVLSGNTLYGTAFYGGIEDFGTVFAVNTNGTNFTVLHMFTGDYLGTNDGSYPQAGLILSGHTLFGTTSAGGANDYGAIFSINTDGTGYTNLYNFTGTADGGGPVAGLVLSGYILYGTAEEGGNAPLNGGNVFSLSFVPQLSIFASGTNVILTWPTNVAGFDYSGFTLQSTTDLNPPAVWTPVVPGPVVINEQFTVTNLISGTQEFYRLSQ